MRKKIEYAVLVIALLFLAAIAAREMSAFSCQATGFQGLTAAYVNPGNLSGGMYDGTGCDIVVYYEAGADAVVEDAVIFGGKRYGVVINGDNGAAAVDILNSDINNIGDKPSFTGNQYGVAVYYRAFFAAGSATGRVSGTRISQYQKGGIVVNGPGSNVQIQDNTILGLGVVPFIAQNGIQFGFGGGGSAMKNRVSGNQYSGSSTFSGGIIVVGGPAWGGSPDGGLMQYSTGIQIMKNILENNDVGVALQNYEAGWVAPTDSTNIKTVNNTITNQAITNGLYQVGVSGVGNNDKIIGNSVSGAGYGPGPIYTAEIDADPSFTNRPKVHANK